MREYELLTVNCGDTPVEIWGEAMSMDDITDYKVNGVSVWEMIHSLDKEGKFEEKVRNEIYEHVSCYGS